MSYIRQLFFFCDGPRETCPLAGNAEYEGIGSQSSVPEERLRLKQRGWIFRGGNDFCAECAKKLEMKP